MSHYDSDCEAAKKLNWSQLLFVAELVFWGSQDTAKNHRGKNIGASLKMNVKSLILAAAPDLVQIQPQGSHRASCCIPCRSTNVPSPQTSACEHSHWPNCTRARLPPFTYITMLKHNTRIALGHRKGCSPVENNTEKAVSIY